MGYRYSLAGLIVGGGIAYWGYTEGIIDLPIAIILAAVGILFGWGYDQGETDASQFKRKDRLPVAIFLLVLGAIFLLASPLFDYGWENWWPIAGAWNLFCSIPLILMAVYLSTQR